MDVAMGPLKPTYTDNEQNSLKKIPGGISVTRAAESVGANTESMTNEPSNLGKTSTSMSIKITGNLPANSDNMTLSPPPGTMVCLLCRGTILYKDKDSSVFSRHLFNEHAAFYHSEFLLASCFLPPQELERVSKTFQQQQLSKLFEKEQDEGRERTGGGEAKRKRFNSGMSKCLLCEKICENKPDLHKHMGEVHGNSANTKKEMVETVSENDTPPMEEEDMFANIGKDNNKSDKNGKHFICDFCPKTLTSYVGMYGHKKKEHNDVFIRSIRGRKPKHELNVDVSKSSFEADAIKSIELEKNPNDTSDENNLNISSADDNLPSPSAES